MNRTTEHQAHVMALIACVEGGGWFYAPEERLYAWAMECSNLKARVTRDRAEAQRRQAFLVERPYHADARNKENAGYRLNRFLKSGGQSDVGHIFATAAEFWKAMRVMNDFTREMARR